MVWTSRLFQDRSQHYLISSRYLSNSSSSYYLDFVSRYDAGTSHSRMEDYHNKIVAHDREEGQYPKLGLINLTVLVAPNFSLGFTVARQFNMGDVFCYFLVRTCCRPRRRLGSTRKTKHFSFDSLMMLLAYLSSLFHTSPTSTLTFQHVQGF
jgi:hypothetical protein